MLQTPNLSLQYIDLNEAQREVVHNNAVRGLDALVQLAVLDRDLASPPGSPTDGQRWIVAASPTGVWAGHAKHVAAWQDGAWRFYVPRVGWLAYVVDEGALLGWNGSAWVDAMAILTTLQNIALLGIGTAADATNPLSAKLNNTLWTAKTVAEGGDGHLRYKMSKESAAKTLSLLMQTNYSGRAEIGLAGDDDLHFKVSADGSAWTEALLIDRTTGATKVNAGFMLTADLSPAQITADQNDYNPAGLATASILRLSTDASRTLTGLQGGGDGRLVIGTNVGSFDLALADQSASSSAANRFAIGGNVVVPTGQSVALIYDATASRWRPLTFVGLGPDGLVSRPAYSFANDPDTGVYRIGANNVGMAVNGAKVLDIGTAGLGVVGTVLSGDGTVSLPAHSFTSDPDSGLYRIGANNVGVACNGAKVLDIATTGVSATGTLAATGNLIVGAGTASSSPLIYVNGGTDSGKGAALIFERGGVDKIYIGTHSQIEGGTSDALVIATVSSNDIEFYGGASAATLLATIGGSGGITIGAPTGGNKGAGALNATAVYDDNTLLTCHALAKEFIETGKVDTAALDALVPPAVIPERIEKAPLMEAVEVEKVTLQRQDDGTFLAVSETVNEKRQVQDWTPIYDANGNGIDAVQEPVFDKDIIHPEQIVPRRNEVGHLFKAMVEEGFDPRDPIQYIARLKKDQALPGMPTQDNWRHGALSSGEIHCRLWLATEMLALVVISLHDRVERLEAR